MSYPVCVFLPLTINGLEMSLSRTSDLPLFPRQGDELVLVENQHSFLVAPVQRAQIFADGRLACWCQQVEADSQILSELEEAGFTVHSGIDEQTFAELLG